MGNAVAVALREAGLSVPPAELDRRIAAAIRELLVHRSIPTPTPADFTPAERAILEAGGFDLNPIQTAETRPILRTAERYAALLATALTVKDAARRLSVDGSRIRQRLLARQVYGIKEPSGWLLPLFQFEGDRLVPGIERVFPRLDPRLHPLAVLNWFTTAQPDLTVTVDADETTLTPLDWLRTGGNPDVVAELAADAIGSSVS